MNKFLKYKYQLIRKLQAKLITAHTPQCVVLDDLIFANNRQMNYVLKLLRSLPTELLISNNPDIAQLLADATQHHNLDATAKTNINLQYGHLAAPTVVVSTLFSADAHAKLTGACQEALKDTLANLSDSVNKIAEIEPATATASMDAYLQKQLEARKEHKRQYIALSHKAKELCEERLKELAEGNFKLQKQLRALAYLAPKVKITFTEDTSQSISQFFNQWIEQVNKGV